MKNLSVVFFFLLAFTFSSVAVQAQTTCKPKDCKKVCTKTAKADTKKAQSASLNVHQTSNATSKSTKKTKANCDPKDCKKVCTKVCTKASKTSVTTKETKTPATKSKIVAIKQE